MNSTYLRHALSLFLVKLIFVVGSPAAYADLEQARLDAVMADLQSRIDADKLSGAVVMAAQDGEILLHEALGHRNLEDQESMQTDTIFRIFSMTKPVTGTALMMLWDEGRFQLDDPVEQHLPELAGMQVAVARNDDGSWQTEPAAHPMTVRELMSHTGGLLYGTADIRGTGCRGLSGSRYHGLRWPQPAAIHTGPAGHPAGLPARHPVGVQHIGGCTRLSG